MKLDKEFQLKKALRDGKQDQLDAFEFDEYSPDILLNNQKEDSAGKRIGTGGEAEDAAPDFMQLAIVRRILKYENDRGGPQNTIDFKIDTKRSGVTELDVIDDDEPNRYDKGHCSDGKTKNATYRDSAQAGVDDRVQDSSTNE